MELKDKLSYHGMLRFKFVNIETHQVIEWWKPNVMTDVGKHSILERLGSSDNGQGKITYCALGIGQVEPAAGDTVLSNEQTRKVIASWSRTDKELIISAFFNTGEANFHMYEVGFFGDDASAAPDSGTLYEHALLDFNKTSSYTLTIELHITFD